MQVLAIHAHPDPTSFSAALLRAVVDGCQAGGHAISVISLYETGFVAAMNAEERRAYHGAEPILDPQVSAHAALVRSAEALVFIYPTWWSGMPAVMKGWLERVLVPGVAFTMDEHNRVRPGLRHVRHLVGVSTYGARRSYVALMIDGGRRTITRALRMSCGRRTRTTWLGLYDMDHASDRERHAFLDTVTRTITKLR